MKIPLSSCPPCLLAKMVNVASLVTKHTNVDVFVFADVSLRFKGKENLQYCLDAFFYINIKEAKKLLPQLCFDTFRNFNRSFNEKLMFPAQTINLIKKEKRAFKRV